MEQLKESYLLQFLMICVMVVFACAKVTLQGAVSRNHLKSSSDSVLFNALLFAVMAVVLALIFPMELFGTAGWILAFLGAIGTFAFQVCYALALQKGPVSLSVLIVNFQVLVVTSFSIIAFHESVYLSQLFGILFLVASMLLSIKKENSEKKFSGTWLILLLVSLIGTASSTIFMKSFTKWFSEGAGQDNGFVVMMYVFASAMAFVWYAIGAFGKQKKQATFGFGNLRVWAYILGIGIVLGIFQKLYMTGMTVIDGGFLFPTYTGLQSVTMTLIGILFFKDRLTGKQKLGVLCGVLCVVLMNIRWIALF